jgi:alkylated DNA repair dioxygenase AlkB
MIEGLVLSKDFVTRAEERALIDAVDKEKWNTSLSRRTQHYGYTYDYTYRNVVKPAAPMPQWCDFVIDRLMERGVITVRPDQMIVNEYLPGQGIAPHIDNVRLFKDGIVSLSLGSATTMSFINEGVKHDVCLPMRSVISLHGKARYDWKHGISPRKTDCGVQRTRRISLTFRKMNH